MSIVEERDKKRAEQHPGPEVRGLPNHYFIDQEHFKLEQKQLFQRGWIFAGVAGELNKPGSVIQKEVGGVPIILTRNIQGEIKAFQNVCPHRGARLVVENKDETKLMVCPYHSWSFDLDGGLRARPHYNGVDAHGTPRDGDDIDCKGLFGVRLATWNGALLVNIDGKAPAIDEYLADLVAQTSDYDLSAMKFSAMISSEFNSNWKLTIENWLDSYHVFAVHPGLDKMMIKEQRKAAIGAGNLVYADYYSTDMGKDVYGGMPMIPNLSDELKNASFFAAQFPNWAVSVHPTYLLMWNYVPLAVNKTRVDVYAHFVGDAATDEAHAEARSDLLTYYSGLNDEDMNVCSLMQQGREAPAYDGGRFSPYWDGGSVHFARNIEQAMKSNQ
jgi:choline monooxygenase